jgi:hypothetical protein
LARSCEQKSATAWQDGSDFREQPALDFRIHQKQKAPGDHTVESSTEEVRILYRRTLNGDRWKVGAKGCDHSRGGVHPVHTEPTLNQSLRNWDASPATQIEDCCAVRQHLGPVCDNRGSNSGLLAPPLRYEARCDFVVAVRIVRICHRGQCSIRNSAAFGAAPTGGKGTQNLSSATIRRCAPVFARKPPGPGFSSTNLSRCEYFLGSLSHLPAAADPSPSTRALP